MLTRLDRYIFKTVAGTALVALLVLLVLETFFSLLIELEDLGKGSYGVAEILQFLLLGLPQSIYQIFPMALLLGGLLGMGALANTSELIVMRASGLSVLRLVTSAMQAGLLLSLLAALLGEFVAPPGQRLAQELRSSATAEAVAVRQGKGFWIRDGDYIVNIRAVLPGRELAEIFIYELGATSELKTVLLADRAQYVDGAWLLEDVARSTLRPERVTADTLPRLVALAGLAPATLEILALDPQDLAVRDLLAYIAYLRHNGLDTSVYELAFWTKLVGPLSNLVMLFIAMPFVFGSQRRIGTGQRLLIGVFLGLLFYLANRMLGNLVLLYGYAPLLGASLPTLAFFAGGLAALRRMR